MGLPQLTPKQIKILDLLIQGLSNQQIGKQIGVSRFTAANYLKKIYDLSGMGTRLEIAMWWMAHRDEILQSGNQ